MKINMNITLELVVSVWFDLWKVTFIKLMGKTIKIDKLLSFVLIENHLSFHLKCLKNRSPYFFGFTQKKIIFMFSLVA